MARLILILLLCLNLSVFAKSSQPLDRIVAVVNDEIITQSEVDQAANEVKNQLMHERMTVPDEKTLKKQILDSLIDQKLELQVAKRNKITVSDSDIDAALQKIAKQSNLTFEELKQKLNEQGISYEKFRTQVQNQLIISKFQQEAIAPTVKITQAEIEAYRNQENQNAPLQYHIATVVLPIESDVTSELMAQKKKQAFEVYARLQQGADFNTVMKDYSGSKDWGWQTANDLPEIFAERVVHMKAGQVSEPIQAQNGFYIIKLTETRKEQRHLTTTDIQNILFRQKMEKALKKFLKQLRHVAYIHIY